MAPADLHMLSASDPDSVHRDREVPPSGAARVFHQGFDDLGADGACSLEAEGWCVLRQWQIVVDSLGHRHDTDFALGALGDSRGAVSGIVAADADEVPYAERRQSADHVLQGRFILRGIGARGPQDGAPGQVYAADVLEFQLIYMAGVALRQPSKALAQSDDAQPALHSFNRRRSDHAVDPGSGSAADKDCQGLWPLIVSFHVVALLLESC